MVVEVQRLLACSVCAEINLVLLDKLVLLGVADKLVLLKNGLKGGLIRIPESVETWSTMVSTPSSVNL